MQSLSGKVALVTGATGGIGRVTALALVAAGAKVVAAGRRRAEGEETVRFLRDAAGEGHFVTADVSRDEDVKRLVEAAVERFGGLPCAVNGTTPNLFVPTRCVTIATVVLPRLSLCEWFA